MKCKILVETNVLVAGSVTMYLEDMKEELRHPFYDQSYLLFDLIRKNIPNRLGIVTMTIERESYKALMGAVLSVLKGRISDADVREKAFKSLTTLVNLCEINMRKVLGWLAREPVDEAEVLQEIRRVSAMVEGITKTAQNYASPRWISDQARKRARLSGRFLREAFSVHLEQLRREGMQYKRFLSEGPSPIDQRILAEASCLLKFYKKAGTLFKLLLASCDSKFFSPYRIKGGIESKPITEQIQAIFGVICDWPRQIVDQATATLASG